MTGVVVCHRGMVVYHSRKQMKSSANFPCALQGALPARLVGAQRILIVQRWSLQRNTIRSSSS
jgi:hypothetical protein